MLLAERLQFRKRIRDALLNGESNDLDMLGLERLPDLAF